MKSDGSLCRDYPGDAVTEPELLSGPREARPAHALSSLAFPQGTAPELVEDAAEKAKQPVSTTTGRDLFAAIRDSLG
jgi:hypothetical protein